MNIIAKYEITPATYQKISRYMKPNTHNALSFVDIPIKNGDCRITRKEELEEHLLRHHKIHFSQVKTTHLARDTIISRFGLVADTDYSDRFSQGDTHEVTYWEQSPI